MSRLRRPRLRLLGNVAGLAVYLVSGEQVRDEIEIEFTQGGNEAAYPNMVPAGEIWIDDAMHALDRTATAFHEIVERDLMLHHGMTYSRAHDKASAHERVFRQNLVGHHPMTFDARRVAAAYRAYLREKSPREYSRQLDREIHTTLMRTKRRL